MKKVFFAMAVLVMAVMMGGCAKVPQAELDAANAAITKAKTAEANVYLASSFNAIQDSLNAINAEIEANKGKLFKSFSDVKMKLSTLTGEANNLVAETEARKDTIREQVTTALTQLQSVSAENAELVKKAPRGKEGKAALESIESEMATINAAAGEIPELLKNGNLLEAQTKVQAAHAQAESINQELKTVIEKYNAKQHRPVSHRPKHK